MPRVPRMYLNTEYFHVITQNAPAPLTKKILKTKYNLKIENENPIKIIDIS